MTIRLRNQSGTPHRSRNRRILAFCIVLAMLVVVFGYRLIDIQIVRADELNEEAAGKRSMEHVVYGNRGDITDQAGRVLAGSVTRYDIALSPKNAGDIRRKTQAGNTTVRLAQVTEELGKAVSMTGPQIQAIISSARAANPNSDFAYVVRDADIATYEAVKALNIPWVTATPHASRVYPDGAVAGNLLGFMGSDGEPLAGLELKENSCLAGKNGVESYSYGSKDGVAIPGTTRTVEEAHNGGKLALTIDSDLQYYAQDVAAAQVNATGGKWATATVMEAKTGRLLAVADVPSVDPNNVTATPSDARGSRSFTAPFEPGSTFKALTAAAVIDAGVADPNTQVVAPYRYKPGNGADINDSEFHPTENLTLTGVLVESSNTGMSQIGEKLSDERRYQYMRAFGVGSDTEAGFLGEESGQLHDWNSWDSQTKYATTFGQGLTTTAVQIASIYQTIANHGVRMPVSLIAGCTAADGTVSQTPATEGKRVISAAAADTTTEMLEEVYTHGWLKSEWNIPGYRVTAKTGTAQVPNGHGGYQSGYLVSVAGYAPADDPQYVVSVSIMDPVNMNSSAAPAPVFQKIMSQVLKKYRVAPSGSPAPELPLTW